MLARNIIVFLLLSLSSAHDGLINVEVVMRGGDPPLQEMDLVDFPTYHSGSCMVRFPRDGNWATQNGFATGGWDANQNSECQSDGPSAMTYKLQTDGNFVAHCGNRVDFATHTGQGSSGGDYFLAIDDACVLHLFKGALGCDSVRIEEEIWTNIKDKPLRNGDRLGKGEMVRHASTTLVMQSSDGNLVLYNGTSGSTDTVLWAASNTWGGFPDPMYRDYHAKVTHNGWLELVGLNNHNGSEIVYFQQSLGVPPGSACFQVEYDADANDLVSVAAPCT